MRSGKLQKKKSNKSDLISQDSAWQEIKKRQSEKQKRPDNQGFGTWEKDKPTRVGQVVPQASSIWLQKGSQVVWAL